MSRERTIWMFPRNIRRTDAWKVAQILSLFEAAIREGTTKSEIEKGFIKNLKKANLQAARALETRDENPGDFRTYRTQLSALGLIYVTQDGAIDFTKAGRDILEGLSPVKILQSQVLRHQYPSCYSLSSQVKIDGNIKLRPFVVVLKLLQDERLNGFLTNTESAIPVALGKTEGDHEELVKAVLKLRAGAAFEEVTHLNSLRTIRNAPGNVKKDELMNIGNTFLNVLIGARLIEKDNSAFGSTRYVANLEYLDLINTACKGKFTPFRNPESNESFQRAYGAWDGKKDTETRNSDKIVKGESPKIGIIKSAYFAYQEDRGMRLTNELPEKFVDETKAHYGFTEFEIKSALESFLNLAKDDDEREFLRIAQGGTTTASAFEKKIRAIFEDNFQIRAYNTGQRKRRNDPGGFTDILLIFESPSGCVILDAKSTSKYELGVTDSRAMKNYCQQYRELVEVRPEMPLLAAGFVSLSFSERVPAKLEKLSSELDNLPLFTLPATTLLSWIKEGKKGAEVLDCLLSLA